jgi:hypothetical protein
MLRKTNNDSAKIKRIDSRERDIKGFLLSEVLTRINPFIAKSPGYLLIWLLY